MRPARLARAGILLTALVAATAHRAAAQAPPKARLEDLERQAVSDSNDPVIHYQLGRAYWDRQRWDDAEREWRAALQLAPEYADAYLGLAALPEARGERYWKQVARDHGQDAVDRVYEERARFFQRAFLIDPLVDLSVLPRVEERVSVRVDGYNLFVWWVFPLTKGLNALRQGRLQDAMQRLERLESDSRAGPEGQWAPNAAWWFHALAAARTHRYDIAVEDFWRLVQRSVRDEADSVISWVPLQTNEYRYMLATMLYLDGRPDQAVPVFRRALEFDVGLYQAHVQLARIFETEGRWDDAVQARNAAIAANPDDATLVVDLGATFIKAGRLEEAAQALGTAMEAVPRDPRPAYLLGQVLARLGQADSAKEAFTHFLDVAPSRFGPRVAEVRAWLQSTVP